MINENDLINTFVKALRNQNASVFIGSGISSESGSPLWKDLIAKYAEDIGYSVSETDDYPFIAQSYINKGHDEKTFKKNIAQNFISLSNPTNVHKILARLPIRNYWTTNYDCLMETALQQESKKYDVIYDNDSFYSLRDAREHIVYKCHGDCAYSSSIVITQKDYERFIIDSFNFTHALYNEFASSTVLFLGYSFSDSDINNILKVLSAINKTNQTHLFITKRETDKSKSEKQNLWILNVR